MTWGECSSKPAVLMHRLAGLLGRQIFSDEGVRSPAFPGKAVVMAKSY
jgi:hypothetical protein